MFTSKYCTMHTTWVCVEEPGEERRKGAELIISTDRLGHQDPANSHQMKDPHTSPPRQ
jgi:hypothetical protein